MPPFCFSYLAGTALSLVGMPYVVFVDRNLLQSTWDIPIRPVVPARVFELIGIHVQICGRIQSNITLVCVGPGYAAKVVNRKRDYRSPGAIALMRRRMLATLIVGHDGS